MRNQRGDADGWSELATHLAAAGVDLVSALTITNAEEAIGIVRADGESGVPVVISFTTETEGRLPSGRPLGEAIEQVDTETHQAAVYFMVNCAHPDHFSDTLDPKAAWTRRIRGVRANASRCSHAELDEATVLDEGDPEEFGEFYRQLRRQFPQISVMGAGVARTIAMSAPSRPRYARGP